MAGIQEKILGKYGIDIAQENLLKLYKIEKPDISDQEILVAINATRKRWNQSINGANEKNAERDRVRLEKADKYEAILKDAKLRREIFAFYKGEGSSDRGSNSGTSADISSLEFAREYFKLVETTKKLKKQDVDFFFDYYKAQRKNKKAILEMLSKEFKVHNLGKGNDVAGEDDDTDKEGKKKGDNSPLIVNLFQEATILKLRNCVDHYDAALQSQAVCQRYPQIREGLYDFIGLKNVETIQQFSELVSNRAKDAFAIRQEQGTEFVPLVDLFNTLKTLSEYQDVYDNLEEFKLLIKYPNLTPYMYSFVEMKPATLKGIVNVANRDYVFRDNTDFILNYYNPVHDNFGISDGGISSIIKKAEKKAKQNKVLNELDEKLGRKKKRKISIGAEIFHWLVYWPIFVLYFVFEVFKVVFTELHKFIIPVFVVLFIGSNWLFPKILEIENLLIFRNIISKVKWYAFLGDFVGEVNNAFDAIILTLLALVILLMIYVLPALFITLFVKEFSEDLNKRFDWVGLERTFQSIFQQLRTKMETQYNTQKNLFVKQRIPKVIINLVCLATFVAIVHFTPIGFKMFSEKTGYFQKEEKVEAMANGALEDTDTQTDALQPNVPMEIIVDTANIYSGPSEDGDVLTTAEMGTVFVATGNQETDSNEQIWYELYLDEGMTSTGWVSQAVIEFKLE